MTAKKPTGRASTFSQAVADRICQRLADKESLRTICRDKDMPNTSTVCKWLGQFPQFAEQYARAREAQADALVDEIVDIADTEENPKRAAVRIDARKWVAGKMKPKKYGDKIVNEHTGKDGGPIETRNEHELGSSIAFALRKAAKK